MRKMKIKPEQGHRLKRCLEYAEMKQTGLAAKAHYSEQTISKIINGHAPLTDPAAYIFAEALKVRPEYLLLKSDYMTDKELTKAQCDNYNMRNESVLSLIESLGYRIIGMKENSNGSKESMHRPYSHITINKSIDEYTSDDSDEQILEKAHSSTPERIFILQSPSGKQTCIEQKELLQIEENIKDFVKFQCEKPFHRFDNSPFSGAIFSDNRG